MVRAARERLAREPGPQGGQGRAVAAVARHAGAADLEEFPRISQDPRHVELLLRIVAAGPHRARSVEDAQAGDDASAGAFPREKVRAVRVVAVEIKPVLVADDAGAHLDGEHVVTQALRGDDVLGGARDLDDQRAGFRGDGFHGFSFR